MPLLNALSPALEHAAPKARDVVLAALEFLPEKYTRAYLNALDPQDTDERNRSSKIRWLLHYAFLYSGALQGIITVDGRNVYSFGAEFIPWSGSRLDLPVDVTADLLTTVVRKESENDLDLVLTAVFPKKIAESVSRLVEAEIIPLARHYFLYLPGLKDPQMVDLNKRIIDLCQPVAEKAAKLGQPLSITHFHFQDMSVYFEMSGERRTFEILEEIIRIIRENLKKNDFLIQLSPLSYLVFSPGARKEQILGRFRSIYFYIKSLVLEYEMHIITLESAEIDWTQVWANLRI